MAIIPCAFIYVLLRRHDKGRDRRPAFVTNTFWQQNYLKPELKAVCSGQKGLKHARSVTLFQVHISSCRQRSPGLGKAFFCSRAEPPPPPLLCEAVGVKGFSFSRRRVFAGMRACVRSCSRGDAFCFFYFFYVCVLPSVQDFALLVPDVRR